jgi:hypothetical protein
MFIKHACQLAVVNMADENSDNDIVYSDGDNEVRKPFQSYVLS